MSAHFDTEYLTPMQVAVHVHAHERTSDENLRSLWYAVIRKTADCNHEQWKRAPGKIMYTHVAHSLRRGAQTHLAWVGQAHRFEEATVHVEQARQSLRALLAYESLVRTHPEVAERELRKGELGAIGHENIWNTIRAKGQGNTVRAYVAELVRQHTP